MTLTDDELRHHLAERDRLFDAMGWRRPEEYDALHVRRHIHAEAALRGLIERGGRFDDGAAIWRVSADGLGITRDDPRAAYPGWWGCQSCVTLSAGGAAALDRLNESRFGAGRAGAWA